MVGVGMGDDEIVERGDAQVGQVIFDGRLVALGQVSRVKQHVAARRRQ